MLFVASRFTALLPLSVALQIITLSPAMAQAFASCMGSSSNAPGAPSLSATDVSTTQAIELIRRRREAAMQQASAPASAEPASAESASSTAAPSESSAASASATIAKSPGKKQKSSSKQEKTYLPSPAEPARVRSQGYGAWANAYLDYERHTNLAPGVIPDLTRNQRSTGFLAGADKTYRYRNAAQLNALQFGVFGGYNNTRNTFKQGTTVTAFEPAEPICGEGGNGTTCFEFATARSKEVIEGGIVGAYGSMQIGPFAADLVLKVDVFDATQTTTTTRTISCTLDPTNVPQPNPAFLPENPIITSFGGSVSQQDYILAPNVYYRYQLTSQAWFEPTLGTRYTHTNYGSNAVFLGLDDGDAFRVQGGARVGTSWVDGGYLWTTWVLGLLYSDVYIDGFTIGSAGLPGGTAQVDEGELRALGRFFAKIEDGTGMSYYLQAEIRGGEDVLGGGGLLGARYEW